MPVIRLLLTFILLVSCSALSSEGPIESFVYVYCETTTECVSYVTITNNTSYNLELESTRFQNNKLSPYSLDIYNARDFSTGKDINNIPYRKKLKPLIRDTVRKSMGRLTFKPFERKEFEIKQLHKLYNFDVKTRYKVQLAISLVDLKINTKKVNSIQIYSDLNNFSFPR